ncbi:MAG TPA: MarC family protein [Alphaproteobacteria bacterium]|nr:MarC family protein [Alphaproteobacteria bacterium]
MLNIYISAFVTLFVIVDPLSLLPLFLSLTQNMTKKETNSAITLACCVSAILLLVFSIGGEIILKTLGISRAAFQAAGGFLLLIAAIEMVIAQRPQMSSTTAKENEANEGQKDIAVFPLAIPLIAGPGSLITVVLLAGQEHLPSIFHHIILAGIIVTVIAITYLFLRGAPYIQKILGMTASNVLTRVFGIILAALAAQFIFNGIKQAFF